MCVFDIVSRTLEEAGIFHMVVRTEVSNHSGGMAYRFLLYRHKSLTI